MRVRIWWSLGGLLLWPVFSGGCGGRESTVGPPAQVGSGVPSEETPLPPPSLPEAPPAPVQAENPPVDAPRPPGEPPAEVPLAAGPWPTDGVRDYSRDFGVGAPQSVALDEALNLWLLEGDRIGVLRPGDSAPTWTRGVGQARDGFGRETLALGSTVICGGEPGRAYVGYRTYSLPDVIPDRPHAYVPSPGEPFYTPERYAEYQKGDLDVVRLQPDGTVALEEHLWRTLKASNKDRQLGIHNTNNFHYDEDRSVLSCQRVTRGPFRGDVYIGTNHGVTRIQGLTYNSHRHPGWYKMVPLEDGTLDPQLQTAPVLGLGIAPSGDVLVANDDMVGILVPSARLEDWDRENTWEGPTPWAFRSFNPELNGQAAADFWRGFVQTPQGRYWLGSRDYGVWSLGVRTRSSGTWTKLEGLPTEHILALEATDDGGLYIGTDGAGLWRLEADGTTLARVADVRGRRVLQLVYEPTVVPRMLLVVTDAGLTVLRGP